MSDPLYVFLCGERVGRLVPLRRGTVHLHYEDDSPIAAPPLSLALPFGQRARLDATGWVDGLLPENPRTRLRWSRELGAASPDPFDLLSTRAGLECAGAVQFSLEPFLPNPLSGSLTELSESEMAAMTRLISSDAAADPTEALGELRLSLPGAQPKMAMRFDGGRWLLPTGMLATTHILKPQKGHLAPPLRDSVAVNEHLCQTAAASLGLDAAATSLAVFEGEQCLVAERFDRDTHMGEVRRTHFEDLCQAMGLPASRKYQSDSGPSPEEIVGLLRQESPGDTRKFFLAMYYNWLIGNTDGHAKNYGLLFNGPQARLAPLYDLNSLAPYAPPGGEQLRMAMRFEGPSPADPDEWAQTATRNGIDVDADELRDMAESLPHAFAAAAAQCPDWAADTAHHISERVVAHSARMAAGAGAHNPFSSLEVLPSPATPTAGAAPAGGICGRQVKRTGMPCLLHPEHRGRCRSVL